MTTEKLISTLSMYDRWLETTFNAEVVRSELGRGMSHLRWMCHECVDKHVPAGDVDKAMRWLGFIQGVLLAVGYFTLEQIKEHSRP